MNLIRILLYNIPHSEAHKTSELNLFLYFLISGVSSKLLAVDGDTFTFTKDPFRPGSTSVVEPDP